MKKTLIAVAAAAAFATSAFAEVTFGGWGRQIWAPVASDGDDTATFMQTSWGGTPRMGYSMDFTSENVDMHADFKLEGMKADINDMVKVTIRPIDGVELKIGKIQDDTLRGNCCYGSWDWMRPSWIVGEDLTMTRMIDDWGVGVKLNPIENLVIVAALPVDSNSNTSYVLAEDVYKYARAGFGYTIDGIGQIKAQFLGKGPSAEKDWNGTIEFNEYYGEDDTGDIEVAFKLSAVENLSAEVGFKMQILDDSDKANKTIGLGATYAVNDVCNVAASACVVLPGDSDKDPEMKFGAGVNYVLDNGIGLVADVQFYLPQNDKDPAVEVLVGASKGFSNGKLSAGFQLVNAKEGQAGFAGDIAGSVDGTVWAIPVCFEYWF